MISRIRVLLYYVSADAEAIETVYHEVSEQLAGVPGLLGSELLRSVDQPGGFVVMSSWSSFDQFQKWEQSAEHKPSTEPLRRFRDPRMGKGFGFYEIAATH